jgi:hypothetical protein
MGEKWTPGPWRRDGLFVVAKRGKQEQVILSTRCLPEERANLDLASAAPDLAKELEQARHDIGLLLDELRAHQENTGEYLEDEDAAVVAQVRATYQKPSPALSKARGEQV